MREKYTIIRQNYRLLRAADELLEEAVLMESIPETPENEILDTFEDALKQERKFFRLFGNPAKKPA